jgi:hypothetical protein
MLTNLGWSLKSHGPWAVRALGVGGDTLPPSYHGGNINTDNIKEAEPKTVAVKEWDQLVMV